MPYKPLFNESSNDLKVHRIIKTLSRKIQTNETTSCEDNSMCQITRQYICPILSKEFSNEKKYSEKAKNPKRDQTGSSNSMNAVT